MSIDFAKQRAALAITNLAQSRTRSQEIEAHMLDRANELGAEILSILDKGPNLSSMEAERLLRLWTLRTLLVEPDRLKGLGKVLTEVRDILASVPEHHGEPSMVEVEL